MLVFLPSIIGAWNNNSKYAVLRLDRASCVVTDLLSSVYLFKYPYFSVNTKREGL